MADLWFLFPVVNLEIELDPSQRNNPRGWRKATGEEPVFIQAIDAWLIEDRAMFSLRVNLTTRETTVGFFSDDNGQSESRLLLFCGGDKRLDIRADPFTLCCGAYAAVLDAWAIQDKPVGTLLRKQVSERGRIAYINTAADALSRRAFAYP